MAAKSDSNLSLMQFNTGDKHLVMSNGS